MDANAQELAEKCAAAMLERDEATRNLGAVVDEISPGRAVLSMEVADHMLNGHNICHGGVIFTLADSAFAFACNTYNQITVAMSAEISFLRQAQRGERLNATAVEVWCSDRSGIYDVSVANQDGERIAEFRGKSRTIRGTLV